MPTASTPPNPYHHSPVRPQLRHTTRKVAPFKMEKLGPLPKTQRRRKRRDKSAGKKVQKMLKNRVHKEQQRISTIGRKIGHGVGRQRGGLTLRRTTSAPSKEPSILLRIPADLSFFYKYRYSRLVQSVGNRSGIVPSLFYPFPSSQPLRFDQRTRPSRIASSITSPNVESSREKRAVKEGTETPQRTMANERCNFPAIGENRASARRYTGGGGQG